MTTTINERDAVRAATLLAAWHLRQPAELTRMRMRNPYGAEVGVSDEALVIVARGALNVDMLEFWYRDRARFHVGERTRVITLEPLRMGDLNITVEPMGDKKDA